MRLSIPVVCGLITLCSCSMAFAAKIYKWTDEKGVTHFSEHPPLNTKTMLVKPQIAMGEEAAGATDASASSSAASSAAKQAPKKSAMRRAQQPSVTPNAVRQRKKM
jgi:hypothetical protein